MLQNGRGSVERPVCNFDPLYIFYCRPARTNISASKSAGLVTQSTLRLFLGFEEAIGSLVVAPVANDVFAWSWALIFSVGSKVGKTALPLPRVAARPGAGKPGRIKDEKDK